MLGDEGLEQVLDPVGDQLPTGFPLLGCGIAAFELGNVTRP